MGRHRGISLVNTVLSVQGEQVWSLLRLLRSRFGRVRLCATHRRQPTRLTLPRTLQARTLEWVAISFSSAWKWKVKSVNRVQLLVTPWTAAHKAPPSVGFSRQEYWSGVPLPSPMIPKKSLRDFLLEEEPLYFQKPH